MPALRVLVQAGGEREGVLHRELGARANGEMRGVGGVAEQHDIAVVPAAAAQRGEAEPARVVGQQPVAAQHAAEDSGYPPDRGLVRFARGQLARCGRQLAESGRLPHGLVHLDDEGAAGGVVGVTVYLHDAERRLLDIELEGIEHKVGAQPHVLALATIKVRLERGRIHSPYRRVRAVSRDNQVVAGGEIRGVRRRSPEADGHAQLGAAVLQDLKQAAPAHRGEPVPAAGDHLAAVVHVDVVPAGELALHLAVDAGIGVLDAAEGLVGEHDAEAEGVVGRVALEDSNLRRPAATAGPGRRNTARRGRPPRPRSALSLPASVPAAVRLCRNANDRQQNATLLTAAPAIAVRIPGRADVALSIMRRMSLVQVHAVLCSPGLMATPYLPDETAHHISPRGAHVPSCLRMLVTASSRQHGPRARGGEASLRRRH